MIKKRKRHTPEQVVKKLRDAEVMLNAGKGLEDARSQQRDHVRSLAEGIWWDEK